MTALIKLSNRFVEVDIDQEIVVMRLDNGEFFALAETGAAIWRLIDGRRDKAALIDALAADYAGGRAEIAADVDELLRQLRDLGLLDDA
jgi:hypothetical protein